jgi:hypothetical protein
VPTESEKERVDRELIELLNELRVALPGVQVLFAFLLTIPFARGFPQTTEAERDIYFVALVSAVISTVLLMAPSAYHRILFRQQTKEQLLMHGNVLAIAGMASLAVSLGTSLFLVAHYVFDSTTAAVVTAIAAVGIAVLWYVVPLWIRFRTSRAS